ncbi:C-type mannose receptor 2-like [Hemibagrus wyckioides]|uniref:C-type mannose receptor 2-like n=1 Tax=Hemibagrus wyckioides TaxID=337641 RepID=UPI00266CCBE3|nr:C-type mannose receptor 2-like [Hemibagrus wyckioides]
MKLVLFLLCFSAAASKPPVRHTYHVVMTKASWTDAQSYCRGMYSDLATIVTKKDLMRLKKELESNNLTSSAWIGLYNDIDSWRWSLNDLKNTVLQKWKPHEPNNEGGNQSCAIIDSQGYWYDEPCADPNPFICYSAGKTGADRFVGVSSPLMSWTEAQTYCRTFHTDLASAFNQTDNDLLQQVASTQGSSWMGLFRDTWKWSDGTIPTDLQWSSGQPDNYYRDEDCSAVYNRVFSDEACTNLYYFICHSFPPMWEQKIVRLQVKSDGSVLDSAVQSSILEQIKQKVKDQGMLMEAAVSWRAQKDGKIFQKKNKNHP